MNKFKFGHSEHTEVKQEHFKGLLDMHLKITRGIISRKEWTDPHYYYFDITAGPGIYEGQDGSPIIFLKLVEAANITYKAVFIESDSERYNQLEKNIELYQQGNIKVHLGNHDNVLPQYFFGINKNKYGLLYADPTGTLPPFELLGQMSQRYHRLDILINCSATNIKRERKSPKTDLKETLTDGLDKIDKQTWIVRSPVGKHQWTFLVGSNWMNFPEWKKQGFHRIESPIGQEILRNLNYTTDEQVEASQLTLF